MASTSSDVFVKRILGPHDVRPTHGEPVGPTARQVRVYRYDERERGWRLSIATHATPGSGQLSLGGFRIAPADRTDTPAYDNDAEAIRLAVGMEEKIRWSRVIGSGGTLGRREMERIAGGKCVLYPTPDARIGQPNDARLLEFAVACCRDFESSSGIRLITGQDLGHGVMSDGHTESLAFLNERFAGSVLANTSRPTAAGNFHVLRGMLRALRIGLPAARVGLIGCGNIGMDLLRRLLHEGAEVVALETSVRRRDEVASLGVRAYPPDDQRAFLSEGVDGIAVNASGGSLSMPTVRAIADNPRARVVCGCENLAMPDPRGEAVLLKAETVYCPTELGGMMGYLTAVEEYLSQAHGVQFEIETMLEAAGRLEVVGFEATEAVVQSGYALSFGKAVERLYSTGFEQLL